MPHYYSLLDDFSVVNNYTIQLDRNELIGMLEISLDISFVRLIEDGH
jgi:hypothetical protein